MERTAASTFRFARRIVVEVKSLYSIMIVFPMARTLKKQKADCVKSLSEIIMMDEFQGDILSSCGMQVFCRPWSMEGGPLLSQKDWVAKSSIKCCQRLSPCLKVYKDTIYFNSVRNYYTRNSLRRDRLACITKRYR